MTGETTGNEGTTKLTDEREHFLRCPECGQAVDMRKLSDIFHHEKSGHKPIPRN
jgi:uncharacterized C2H2 Zn-finger protein